MRSDIGEVDLGLVSYLRYLNQHGMDDTYTSAFGQSFDVTPREDFQLAKVQMTLRGWLFDPRFGYNAYVWTSQTSQGLGAQVVVAGNINWTFDEALRVYFGIHSVPSTRSTNRTFPYWLRNDSRPIADEFFRGSYTQGIWAEGKIARGLEYRVMLANNLSALGVQARQLDANPNTFSAALTWTPINRRIRPGERIWRLRGTPEARDAVQRALHKQHGGRAVPARDQLDREHSIAAVGWNPAVQCHGLRDRTDNPGPLPDDGPECGRQIQGSVPLSSSTIPAGWMISKSRA